MSNLVQFEEWSDEDFEKDKQRAEKQKQGKYLRYGESGKLSVRFLPPRPGEPRLLDVYEHFYKNEDGKWIKYPCPERAGVRDCADCAQARKLFATGNEQDEKKARDICAKLRVYANVIDRDDEEFGPKIVQMRASQRDKLLTMREAIGDFTHPEGGADVILTKKGAGFNTKYDVFNGQQCPLGDMGWIERQANLRKEVGTVPSLSELAEMGVALPDEDEDDEDAPE